MAIQKLSIPEDRTERLHYIRRHFSQAKGPDLPDDWAGGRLNALKKLNSIDITAYARNHHFLNGASTHLSPYLRHGCITLGEAFNSVKTRFGVQAEKLLMQLAWRDYWSQVWFAEGDAIFSDLEPPKVLLQRAPLSADVKNGKTDLPCMDAFILELIKTGYIHNHARLWLASYLIHHRKVDWREAADWLESHLLDGDFASNHLSWQWVASTFSSKPYFSNKETISRFSGGRYCDGCLAQCPFDASYEILTAKLFNAAASPTAKQYVITHLPKKPVSTFPAMAVFVHDEMLSAANTIFDKPFPKFFVFDPQLHGTWSLNRLQFVADCLSEIKNIEVWMGDTEEVLIKRGVGRVVTQDTPNRRVRELLDPFVPKYEPVPKLANVEISAQRLKRFSRYWEKVSPMVLPRMPAE